MARDGVAVDPKLAAAVAAYVNGDRFKVAAKCRELEVSTQTFYKYLRRFGAEGVDGFFPRSRTPLNSPTRLPGDLVDVLVATRKSEQDQGWDYGADAVLLRLQERPDLWPADRPLPCRATINRAFEDRGQLVKTPQRQPRPKPRRFARTSANALWQFDGFLVPYRLGDGTRPVVLHLVDDCSRLFLALQIGHENTEDIWATFTLAVDRYGLPAQVLTDNARAFSGRRLGWTAEFETNLAALHIEAITCRVNHPQTCGKDERGHQRVLKWLRRQPVPTDAAQLQAALDRYRDQYNNRRNQVLDGLTPAQRWALEPLATPAEHLDEITHVTTSPISGRGAIAVDNTLIGLGRRYAGLTATVFRTGNQVAAFHGHQLLRELTIDRSKRYQPRTDLR